MATDATHRSLYRVREGAYAGGVCAGIAAYFELDTIVVRILAVMTAILTLGLAVLVYLGMWASVPLEPELRTLYDVTPESAESSAFGCVDCLSGGNEKRGSGIPLVARLAVAAGVMVLYLVVAMGISPMVPGTQWWQFWPLCLLMVGLCFIIIPIQTNHEAAWHAAGIILTSLSAGILPMSLGIMSWSTVACAFGAWWPLVVVSAGLLIVGFVRGSNALVLAGAFCFVAFCLAGVTLCVVPGEIESLFLHMPTGRSITIAIIP